jgi:hypothetical protein
MTSSKKEGPSWVLGLTFYFSPKGKEDDFEEG